MAITLTTSEQEIGVASDSGFKAQLYGWYSGQSGNTATVNVKLRVTYIDSNYAYYYGTNKSYTLNFNGTSSAQYTPQMNLNSGVDMVTRTQSGVTGGSSINASGSWYSYNYGTINVGLKDTVKLPTFGPSGLAISNITPTTNSVSATVSVTSWNGGDESTRYRSLSLCTAQNTTQRKYAKDMGSTLSSTIPIDNTTPDSSGTAFTITANSRYYVTMYAYGSSGLGNSNYTQVVTLPPIPTITFASSTSDSATFNYSVVANGGFYNQLLQYSLDNGATWTTAKTITSGSGSSGTFTITGLTNGTYNMKIRSSTTAGNTPGAALSFTVGSLSALGSVGGNATQITSALCSVNGVATPITGVLMSVNGIETF